MKNYLSVIITFFAICNAFSQNNNVNLLVGTYSNSCESKGLYVFDFDTITGSFKLKNNTEKIINPSFLSVSADKKKVYSVNENGDNSMISCFDFNSNSGEITINSDFEILGKDPCHIINDGKNVILANYSSGSIEVFRKNSKGNVNFLKQKLTFKGNSIHKRQESPHLHQVQFSPDKKYVLATDLGTDKIYVFDYKRSLLNINNTVSVKKGSGPRHLTFSKNGKFVYLLQELDGSLTVFNFENGNLSKLQENTINAENFIGDISAAEIDIAPNGKFLYATNRGTANDISCFEIQENGLLKFVSRTSTLGKGPRSFAIDNSGNFLLVAHQYTNDIFIFKIDKITGVLTDTGNKIELCSPVCLVFSEF